MFAKPKKLCRNQGDNVNESLDEWIKKYTLLGTLRTQESKVGSHSCFTLVFLRRTVSPMMMIGHVFKTNHKSVFNMQYSD